MKMETEEVAPSGYGASKDEVSSCGWVGACRKIEIEEADGGSGRQKECDFAVFCSWKRLVWRLKRSLYFGHTVLGRGSLDGEVVP